MRQKIENPMIRINVRILEEERKLLQRQANREKRSLSELVRKVIRLYMESKN